jgi:Rod binding domain-containing protein
VGKWGNRHGKIQRESEQVQTELLSGEALTGQQASAVSPRLTRAAHEFEGLMMKELLRPMMQHDGLTGEEDDTDPDSSSGALGEFALEALGQALSQQGGLGIANSIIKELSYSGNQTRNGKVTTKQHRDTVMRTPE